jgi:hypothetical protein
MSSGRRPAPPDLKGTLGTLLRTTLHQVGAVTEAARQKARSQRVRLDGALLERRRQAALAALGELVYELAVSGQLGDLEEMPELARALDDIEAVEQRLADSESGPRQSPREAWGRPPRPREDDDAVAPQRARQRRQASEPLRVWRPPADPVPDMADAEVDDIAAASAPSARPAPRRRVPSRAGGGIAFIDDGSPAAEDADADLADYMHEDDVPARASGEPSGEPSADRDDDENDPAERDPAERDPAEHD